MRTSIQGDCHDIFAHRQWYGILQTDDRQLIAKESNSSLTHQYHWIQLNGVEI